MYTGVSHARIRENLFKLNQAHANIILRCPIIPTYNARQEHYQGIIALANQLSHITEVHILPYHSMGCAKGERLGSPQEADIPPLSAVEQAECIKTIEGGTTKSVRLL